MDLHRLLRREQEGRLLAVPVRLVKLSRAKRMAWGKMVAQTVLDTLILRYHRSEKLTHAEDEQHVMRAPSVSITLRRTHCI